MKYMGKSATAIGLLALVLGAGAAVAGELSAVVSYAIVEVDAEGNEVRAARDVVRPGEVIEYVLRHENETDGDISGLAVVGPVPNGTTFVSQAMTSSLDAVFEVQAEMDPDLPGLEWSTLPAVRIVVAEDGSRSEEPLPDALVQAVRWRIDAALGQGEAAENTYRVIVN